MTVGNQKVKQVRGWKKQKHLSKEGRRCEGGRQKSTESGVTTTWWKEKFQTGRRRSWLCCTYSVNVVMLPLMVPPSLHTTCCKTQTDCTVSHPLTRDDLHWSRHWQHLLFYSSYPTSSHTHTHTHPLTHAHPLTHTHARTHAHTHTHTHAHTHTHTQAFASLDQITSLNLHPILSNVSSTCTGRERKQRRNCW